MRYEKDSMGQMELPDGALFGASTQRAVLNFPISGYRAPAAFIRATGLLKWAAATANEQLGKLNADRAACLREVAWEVCEGKLDEHFPVDVFQTGSATSWNMNANEVIANRASQLAGKPLGSREPLHPNDHCNLGQSSNDTMPTALHVSLALALRDTLQPALERLADALEGRADAFAGQVKMGRTHWMDATPLSVGQAFSSYARQVRKAVERAEASIAALRELAIGGTAVGTGINTHRDFAGKVVAIINEQTGMHFRGAENHFEAQAARDDCVAVAGQLTTIAVSLHKIANDIRMSASGPRGGLGELRLPATQPGSSIMPGKVNPVMCEMLIQTCLYVRGLCHSVALCGTEGAFELNVSIPLMAHALHESIRCLGNASRVFADRCVEGIDVDGEQCDANVRRSLMLVTALNPHIGYDKAAAVAKKAFEENKTLREVVLEEGLMAAHELDRALDPSAMIGPG
jgi:fumarate hydratase class II